MSTKPQQVRVSRRFNAPAERMFDVWLAWLDPAGESRVGAEFRFPGPVGGIAQTGEYLLLDRPRRLVFSCPAEADSCDLDLVTVHLVSMEAAGCELELIHELTPRRAERVEWLEREWRLVLDRMAATPGEVATARFTGRWNARSAAP